MADALPPAALHFRADHAVLSPGSVQLSGGVVLSAERWRVRAEQLRLSEVSPGLYDLQGPLALWPCPCAGAPLSLRVDRARLDLAEGEVDAVTVRDAVLRLGGLPVLYFPWLQLRSERRWGLLPPRAALRAADGWLLGAGVHAPLGSNHFLDLSPALYLRGGHELLARARLAEGLLDARWDHRSSDLLALQGQGRALPREGVFAWSIDARRGGRARAATLDLDDAARASDRARAALLLPWGGTLSTGVRASALRGEGAWVAGPQTSWAGSSRSAGVSWLIDASILQRGSAGASSALRAEVEAGHAWWWGPLRLRPSVRSLGGLVARPDGAQGEAAAVAGALAEVPLLREGPTTHHLAPGLWLGALAAGQHGGSAPWLLPPLPPGASALAAARVQSAWLWPSGARVSLRPSLGAVASPGSLRPAARAVLGAENDRLGAWVDAAARGTRGGVVTGSFSLKSGDFLLTGRAEGQAGEAPSEVRLLDGSSPWLGAWFSAPGWSFEGRAEAPLGGGVRAGLGAWGVPSGLLGERMDVLYKHRCGCLGAGLHAARRLGREGTDLWFSLSLG